MRAYLDYNATAPLRPEAKTAMLSALDAPGNALSVHGAGRGARALVEHARRQIATAVGSGADDVIFTSGGTEANTLAIRGALQAASAAGERITRLIISAIEHDSVRATAAACEEEIPGVRVIIAPVTASGTLDLDTFTRLLNEGKGRALVSIMAANNETGALQPVAEAAARAKAHKALVHCDAVQALGKVDVDIKGLGVDYLSLSAHKVGGPQGVGALIVRPGAPLASQLLGGGQEFGRRAGTHNVAGIAAFGAAVDAATRNLPNANARTALERKLKAALPDAVIFAEDVERLPNTICIAASAVPSENMVIALDLDGFAVSAGAACSSGKVTQSHVLTAMGVEPNLAASAIRVSFGWATQEQELSAFADAWARIVKRAASRAAA
jgi:cysteine desulfurase